MTKYLYFDYMSSSALDPEVCQAMLPFIQDIVWSANPASVHHAMGQMVYQKIEEMRSLLAQTIGAQPEELIFTSGATEANNLAIQGAAKAYQRQGKHLISMMTEHSSVLNVFQALEAQGFDVTYLKPMPNGLLDLDDLKRAIRADTILLSVMQVNNEIGVIQDIAAIAALAKAHGLIVHVDAAQSIGRLPIDLAALPVDLMTFSAHKAYGPKGIGALFVRQKPRLQLLPLLYGGHQEKGLRPGTLATPLIVGMAKAFEKAQLLQASEQERLLAYRQQIEACLNALPGVQINGSLERRIAGNLNFSIHAVDASEIISAFHPLIVSSQSACAMGLNYSSHVLKALGLSDALARTTIRLSFGRFTQAEDVNQACDILKNVIPKLQKMN